MESAVVPKIYPEKCNGCGLCVEVCTCKSLTVIDNVVVYTGSTKCNSCTRWCHQCELVCPAGAISCPFEVVVEEK